jgi:hypothetical protein
MRECSEHQRSVVGRSVEQPLDLYRVDEYAERNYSQRNLVQPLKVPVESGVEFVTVVNVPKSEEEEDLVGIAGMQSAVAVAATLENSSPPRRIARVA